MQEVFAAVLGSTAIIAFCGWIAPGGRSYSKGSPSRSRMAGIRKALAKAGVEFTNGKRPGGASPSWLFL